jgi:hypothetical protein
MADEYTFALSAAAPAIDFTELITSFEQFLGLKLYRVESQGTRRSYSFTGSQRSNWPEDVLISAAKKEWYVAFYCAIPSQRTAILTGLAHCLQEVGVTGTFEEI